jgi:hypothetical protein
VLDIGNGVGYIGGMKMFLSIAAQLAANLLLPLFLAVCAVARAIASIITYDPTLAVQAWKSC